MSDERTDLESSGEGHQTAGTAGTGGREGKKGRVQGHASFQLASELYAKQVGVQQTGGDRLRRDRVDETTSSAWDIIIRYESGESERWRKEHDELRRKNGEPGDRVIDE